MPNTIGQDWGKCNYDAFLAEAKRIVELYYDGAETAEDAFNAIVARAVATDFAQLDAITGTVLAEARKAKA